jgi:hypothetical protein
MAPFFVQGSQADPVSSANGSTLPEQQQANAYHTAFAWLSSFRPTQLSL